MQNTNLRLRVAVGALACALTLQGCGLDKVQAPTSLVGPSELGNSIEMRALPDIVVADGIQTSVIQAVVRDNNGKPLVGKPVVFTIADEEGRTAEIGQLTSATGARVFGDMTDPDSEIRWVLANKRVFILKEDLGTLPRFFYFFDV